MEGGNNCKHDVFVQMELIQHVLSENRRPIGFFIGAGCPCSIKEDNHPLIPNISDLTDMVRQELASKDSKSPSLFDRFVARMESDGIETPNIEDILSRIRVLKPIAGEEGVKGFNSSDLEKIEERLCKSIMDKVNKELSSGDTPYHDLAFWIRSIERYHAVHLFTTNYDLLLEQALEESFCPYFDGFVGNRKAFFDLQAVEEEQLLNPRWTRFWKIHGSINWELTGEGEVVRGHLKDQGKSSLIYPSHLKYDQSRKMPYLAMLDRLKYFLLTQNAVLFVAGYSFNDEHYQ